jgi:hypothetical protein
MKKWSVEKVMAYYEVKHTHITHVFSEDEEDALETANEFGSAVFEIEVKELDTVPDNFYKLND